MRITDASVHPYEAPLARAYVSATARHETREGFVVHLETDDGTEGLGEAAPLSNRTESLAEARSALAAARDELAGLEVDLDRVEDLDDEIASLADAPTARFAVELAILDALARWADRPLAQFLSSEVLGGRRPPEAVPVNATIPACEPDETRQRTRAFADAGFSTIKLKATGEWTRDLERVQAAREADADVALRLDVNGAWPDLATARERMQALAPYELEYAEQPLAPDAVDEMAKLRAQSPVAVAADEPVLDLASAREIVQRGAADVLVCKPMVLGGPIAALGIARMAEAHDVPVVVTSTIDGAIGRAGALHTAAALGEPGPACGLATGGLIEREPAAFDERIEGGRLFVPGAAGHGAWLTEPLEAIG